MVDSIHPITPGPPALSGTGRVPVERPERVTRDRDRQPKDGRERKRREPPGSEQPPAGALEDDGRPHIDVRV